MHMQLLQSSATPWLGNVVTVAGRTPGRTPGSPEKVVTEA